MQCLTNNTGGCNTGNKLFLQHNIHDHDRQKEDQACRHRRITGDLLTTLLDDLAHELTQLNCHCVVGRKIHRCIIIVVPVPNDRQHGNRQNCFAGRRNHNSQICAPRITSIHPRGFFQFLGQALIELHINVDIETCTNSDTGQCR